MQKRMKERLPVAEKALKTLIIRGKIQKGNKIKLHFNNF
jgi:hypothetical protein